MNLLRLRGFIVIFIYLLNFITSVHLSTIPTNDIEIYTTDWQPTPQVCVQGRVKGLIQVYETSFRGQPPWRLRERLISQAINKTIEIGADYICNAKFEQLSYQWEAMYGTAVSSYDWKENITDGSNKENTTIVPQLPDYDDIDDPDGSGASENITTIYFPTSQTDNNFSNNSSETTNSTLNSDEHDNFNEDYDVTTVINQSTNNGTTVIL